MKDFTDIETVYEKTLKPVSLKRNKVHVADPDGAKAGSPGEIYELLKTIYAKLDDDQEHMVMLVLNVSNDVSGFKVISSGTQSANPADAKIIFRNALMLGAAKIVLAHNHPSGSLKPSQADIVFTNKIIKAGRAIDIPVVDHMILADTGYFSMRAEDVCKFESFV